MGDTTKRCPMCGAVRDEPCTVISADPADDLQPGDLRPVPHFYRATMGHETVATTQRVYERG